MDTFSRTARCHFETYRGPICSPAGAPPRAPGDVSIMMAVTEPGEGCIELVEYRTPGSEIRDLTRFVRDSGIPFREIRISAEWPFQDAPDLPLEERFQRVIDAIAPVEPHVD